jgi:hypothetical protein
MPIGLVVIWLIFGASFCAMGSADSHHNSSSNATSLIASASQVSPEPTSRTIIQTLEMMSLDGFANIDALRSTCKDAVVTASSVPELNVVMLIEKVKVTVTLCFSASPVASASTLREAIARHVGVSISAVDVKETTQRRLIKSLPTDRRLTTLVLAEIDASSDVEADNVQAAREIHTSVQNKSAIQAAVSEKAGTAVNLSSVSAVYELKMRSTISANLSSDALEDAAFNERVGQAIGGTVTAHYLVDGVVGATSTATVTGSTTTFPGDATSAEGVVPLNAASRSAKFFISPFVIIMVNSLVYDC